MTVISNPFFSPAQIEAFNQKPPEAQVKTLNGNSYLEGTYIIAALNALVGPGMWMPTTRHVSTKTATVMKTITRNNVKQEVETHYVAVELEVTLTIRTRDGSQQVLTYTEPGVGDGECPATQNIANAIEKASTTAATAGLKRCARHLGRAFGLDLANKIKALPRIQVQPQQAQAAQPKSNPAPATAEQPAQTDRAAEPRNTAEAAPQSQPTADKPTAAAADTPPPAKETASKPVPESTPEPAADASQPQAQTAAEHAKATPTNDAPKAAGNVKTDNANRAEALVAWNLDLTPKSIEEWQRCARQLRERINGSENARNLEGFLRQRQALVKSMPQEYKTHIYRYINERFAALKSRITAEVIFDNKPLQNQPAAA